MNRLRKLGKTVAILASFLAACFAIVVWRDSANREAAISQIREAGEPVSIADMRPNDVPADINAATFLIPISDELKTLVFEVFPIASADDFEWKSGLTDTQQQTAETIFASHATVEEALQRASQCEVLHWPLNYEAPSSTFMESLQNHVQNTRDVTRFHVAKTRTVAANGAPDAAVNVCLQGLQIIRLQLDSPTIVVSMVNNACRNSLFSELGGLLMHHSLKPETHQAIEDELSQHDTIDSFVLTLKSERAFGISSFDEFPLIPGISWVTSQMTNYVQYMDEQIVISGKWPFEQTQTETVQAIGMSELLVPAVKSSRETHFRLVAYSRCVRVLNAIQSLNSASQTPAITELGLPAAAIVDPFTGNPLILKKVDAGWSVYSVGPDQTDDGGHVASEDSAPPDVGV